MKTNYQLILRATFLVACLELQSQTLTCQYNCPQIGEVFSTKTSSPVIATSGLNQLWDFSQVKAVSTAVTLVSYLDPVSVPSSNLFSQANVARFESGKHTFLDTGSDGVKLASSGSATVNMESIVLPLPFSYGSSHTEAIIRTFVSGSDTIKVTSSKSIHGVGTGTLILPSGTYKDVLRISGQKIESQTKNGLPDGYIYNTHLEYYYSEKISHPLLYSEYMYVNGPGDYAPFTQFISSLSTGIRHEKNEVASGITVTPNPASGIVRVTTSINDECEITLRNSSGEIVLQQRSSAGTTELNISALPEGLYVLLILQRGDVHSKKFVIDQ